MSESPWTFAGESAPTGEAGVVTLVDGTTFMVCGHSGDLGMEPQGLFMLDTRVVSRWDLRVNGSPVQPLAVTPNGPFSATFAGRIAKPGLADAPITVMQRRHVGRGMREDLDIRNYGAEPRSFRVTLGLAADFAGLFDVKAGRPTSHPAGSFVATDSVVQLASPHGRDRTVDMTTVESSIPFSGVAESSVFWDVELDPGQRWDNCLIVAIQASGRRLEPNYRCGESVEQAIPMSRLRQWRDRTTTIETDNSALASAFRRASEDLAALRIFDPEHPERAVVAAGAPWYMTLFGRDSLFASWMALPLDHELARGVLQELRDTQGSVNNRTTEEQPGRILHEVRFDNGQALGGGSTYYGTVDATPLFVMLVAELARWTGVTSTIRDLMPAVNQALQWVEQFGDRDGDGFVEYERSDPDGLENQGWKDSWDGIRYRDGTIAVAPLALCEVQGYVYAAYRGRADLARAMGEGDDVAADFEKKADLLRLRFDEQFWLEDLGWYAIGLDADKKPIDSLASNIGHLLWTGIVPEDRAARLADHLVSPTMFTGWGIRTLASDTAGYNPLSYHCGSVWPHDTALAVAGLTRYGFHGHAHRVLTGLVEAATWSDGRLPELFGGFGDDDVPSPIPYPSSCSPQAWAAAAPLLLVRSVLGFDPDLLNRRVQVRPRLPTGTSRLRLTGVPIGTHRISIAVDRDGVVVDGLGEGLELLIDAGDR